MEQFLEKMADVLEEDISNLKQDTNIRDLPTWDSLAQLSFLALAQDDYGKELTSDDLKGASTLEDLFKLVNG